MPEKHCTCVVFDSVASWFAAIIPWGHENHAGRFLVFVKIPAFCLSQTRQTQFGTSSVPSLFVFSLWAISELLLKDYLSPYSSWLPTLELCLKWYAEILCLQRVFCAGRNVIFSLLLAGRRDHGRLAERIHSSTSCFVISCFYATIWLKLEDNNRMRYCNDIRYDSTANLSTNAPAWCTISLVLKPLRKNLADNNFFPSLPFWRSQC